MTDKPKLWKFELDCGRNWIISSAFLATDKEIKSLNGRHIYLNDVLGKHSEIFVHFKEGSTDYNLYSVEGLSEQTITELFESMGVLIGGWFYPFDYDTEYMD